MSWLGDVVGSVAGSLFGSAVQNHYNSANAEQANAWNVENYKHRYQWSIQDMESAGLNPILAATNGIGGSISGASAASVGYSNPADSYASMGSSSAARKQANTAEKLAGYEAERKAAESQLLQTQEVGQMWKNGLIANDKWVSDELLQERYKYEKEKMKLELSNLRKMGIVYDTSALSNVAAASRSNSASAFDQQQTRLSKQEADFYDSLGGSNSAWSHILRGASILFK